MSEKLLLETQEGKNRDSSERSGFYVVSYIDHIEYENGSSSTSYGIVIKSATEFPAFKAQLEREGKFHILSSFCKSIEEAKALEMEMRHERDDNPEI